MTSFAKWAHMLLIIIYVDITIDGDNYYSGLRTETHISEHDFSCNFSHYISRRLHDMDKEVAPQDRPILSTLI